MTLKRDARGTLRDYERELEGELLSVFLGLFKSFEILGVAFPATSFFEPDGDSPWGSFSPFNETYPTHTTFPIATTEKRRIMSVTFRGDETKIFSAIVESISIYVVYKSPTVLWLSDNMVMNKVVSKSSIAIIAFIKFNSKELLVVNIFIKYSISNKFMPNIVQRRFYCIAIYDGIVYNSYIIYGGDGVRIASLHSPVMKLAEPFSELWVSAPWNLAYHTDIISKNYKISRRING